MSTFEWSSNKANQRAHRSTSLIRGAVVVWVVMLVWAAAPATAGETHVFTVGLFGDPEVGCIVTTEDGACARGTIRGRLIADGDSTFEGVFEFNLPGLRQSARRPLRRIGRGRLEGVFTPSVGEEPKPCLIKGRVNSQGIFLPTGSSAQRFHTGSLEGRGRCGSERVRLEAIWSGAIGPVTDPMIFDFERFQGRLAGTLLFR